MSDVKKIFSSIPKSNLPNSVRVMLAGYKQNGGVDLSTIQFCEAQVKYMLENGIPESNAIIDEYRNQIELERGRL